MYGPIRWRIGSIRGASKIAHGTAATPPTPRKEDLRTVTRTAAAEPANDNSPWPVKAGPVLLREATAEDIETLLAFRNDAQVNQFMLRTSVDPEAFRRNWLAVPGSDTDFSCVVEVDGQLVAMGFLDLVDGMGQPGMPRRTEGVIGYVVDPRHTGHGYATHTTVGLLTAAFDPLGLRRVTAGCFADNRASVSVLEKAGMRREQHGVQDSWHAQLGWVDGFTYALLAEEWSASDR